MAMPASPKSHLRSAISRESPSLDNALLSRKCNFQSDADLISRLPDDILISIISSLPVTCAIQTSILSQRWRNVYNSMPYIELSCRNLLRADGKPHDSTIIINLVCEFLRLRSGSKIHTFVLKCCLNKSVMEELEQSIFSLGQLGVQDLILSCDCCKSWDGISFGDISFSPSIFSFIPTLKRFKLSRCSLQPSLSAQLCDSLQILCLHFVRLLEGAVESILSNCPRIHTLTLRHCGLPSKLCLTGPNLQLQRLCISYCNGVEEIELYASNLNIFEFGIDEVVDLIFDHVPQLQTICLYITGKDIMPCVGGKLARDLPRLKNLIFASKSDSFQESNSSVEINMFRNLRRLDFTISGKVKINLLLLSSFLQSCPILQDFHLNIYLLEYSGAPQLEKQPLVNHTELRNMAISGFEGAQNEIEFALYVLRSAVRLEKMQISRCRQKYMGFGVWNFKEDETPWSEETHKMIDKQLQHVSKTAQLIIQHQGRVDVEDYRLEAPFF